MTQTTALYSFWWAEDETAIGNLQDIPLTVCPRVGEQVIITSEEEDTRSFGVVKVRHIISTHKEAEHVQTIDVFVKG